MICPLYRSKSLAIGKKTWQICQNEVLPTWNVRKKTEQLFLQWQSNAADWLLGARMHTLPQDPKSVVPEQFMKTSAIHSCSSTAPRRPSGRLRAFGHITCIPCHNPSAPSLPTFSPQHAHTSPTSPSSPPRRDQGCQIWTDFGKSTGSLSVKAASTTQPWTLCLC